MQKPAHLPTKHSSCLLSMLLPHEEIFILTTVTGVLAVLARYLLGVSPLNEEMRQKR